MKIFCLHCINGFDSSRVVWRLPGGEEYHPARKTWRDAMRELVAGRSAVDDSRSEAMTRLASGASPHCPVHDCALPEEMVDRPSIVVGMVGEKGSSKTSILTSMCERVGNDKRMAKMLNFALTADSVERWEVQRRQQFESSKPVENTNLRQGLDDFDPLSPLLHSGSGLSVREPIVIKVGVGGVSVNYVFLDVAGEEVLTGRYAARVSAHLAVADHLWFFLTPNLNESLVERMRQTGRPDVAANLVDGPARPGEHGQSLARTQVMVEEIAALWKSSRGLGPSERIGRPRLNVMAVLTKVDLMSGMEPRTEFGMLVDRIAPPPDWVDNADAVADLLDVDALETRSTDTGRVVESMYPQLYNTLVSHFPDTVFLPAAATGTVAVRVSDDPDSDRVYDRIKPYGVVDMFYATVLMTDELPLAKQR